MKDHSCSVTYPRVLYVNLPYYQHLSRFLISICKSSDVVFLRIGECYMFRSPGLNLHISLESAERHAIKPPSAVTPDLDAALITLDAMSSSHCRDSKCGERQQGSARYRDDFYSWCKGEQILQMPRNSQTYKAIIQEELQCLHHTSTQDHGSTIPTEHTLEQQSP